MKTIELKIQKEDIGGKPMIFTTYELLRICINEQKPEGGFNVDEMIKRIRLLTKLDEVKDLFKKEYPLDDESYKDVIASIELEDSDYDLLRSLVLASKWTVVSRSIVELYNTFK